MVTKNQKPYKPHLRSCVACQMKKDKRALIRFVLPATGVVVCDATGRQAGRGTYLCDEQQCFDRARKGHLIDRSLKTRLSDADYQRLEEEFVNQRSRIDRV